MCKKIAYVIAIVVYFCIFVLLLSGCGPVLFTVAGHNVTVGGIVLSQTVKQVIKDEDERKN
jgi:uncharacterized protein YceK